MLGLMKFGRLKTISIFNLAAFCACLCVALWCGVLYGSFGRCLVAGMGWIAISYALKWFAPPRFQWAYPIGIAISALCAVLAVKESGNYAAMPILLVQIVFLYGMPALSDRISLQRYSMIYYGAIETAISIGMMIVVLGPFRITEGFADHKHMNFPYIGDVYQWVAPSMSDFCDYIYPFSAVFFVAIPILTFCHFLTLSKFNELHSTKMVSVWLLMMLTGYLLLFWAGYTDAVVALQINL